MKKTRILVIIVLIIAVLFVLIVYGKKDSPELPAGFQELASVIPLPVKDALPILGLSESDLTVNEQQLYETGRKVQFCGGEFDLQLSVGACDQSGTEGILMFRYVTRISNPEVAAKVASTAAAEFTRAYGRSLDGAREVDPVRIAEIAEEELKVQFEDSFRDEDNWYIQELTSENAGRYQQLVDSDPGRIVSDTPYLTLKLQVGSSSEGVEIAIVCNPEMYNTLSITPPGYADFVSVLGKPKKEALDILGISDRDLKKDRKSNSFGKEVTYLVKQKLQHLGTTFEVYLTFKSLKEDGSDQRFLGFKYITRLEDGQAAKTVSRIARELTNAYGKSGDWSTYPDSQRYAEMSITDIEKYLILQNGGRNNDGWVIQSVSTEEAMEVMDWAKTHYLSDTLDVPQFTVELSVFDFLLELEYKLNFRPELKEAKNPNLYRCPENFFTLFSHYGKTKDVMSPKLWLTEADYIQELDVYKPDSKVTYYGTEYDWYVGFDTKEQRLSRFYYTATYQDEAAAAEAICQIAREVTEMYGRSQNRVPEKDPQRFAEMTAEALEQGLRNNTLQSRRDVWPLYIMNSEDGEALRTLLAASSAENTELYSQWLLLTMTIAVEPSADGSGVRVELHFLPDAPNALKMN